jgi:hypothetical protein
MRVGGLDRCKIESVVTTTLGGDKDKGMSCREVGGGGTRISLTLTLLCLDTIGLEVAATVRLVVVSEDSPVMSEVIEVLRFFLSAFSKSIGEIRGVAFRTI